MDFSKSIFKGDDGKANWDAIANAIEGCDETALSYFQTLDDGNGIIDNQSASVEGLGDYLDDAGKSFDFATFKANLFNTALNAGIILLASFAIDGIIKAWDYLNETVEEQEQKISELSSSISTLQSEYDELSQKQDVTDAEKRRLEYLERRLELDERILKAEQAQLFDEKTGNKFTDLFDKDNLNTQYLGEMNIRNSDGYAGQKFKYNNRTDDISKVREQISEWKQLQSTVEEGSKAWDEYQKRIDNAINQESKYIDQLSEQENQLTINLGKYADNIEYLQSQLDSGDLTEDQTATAKEQLSQWQQMYDTVELMITEIQKLNGTYSNENKIKDILSQPEFEKTSKQLEELGKSGKLSVTTLSSSFPELINRLDEAGISAQELYQYIMSLSDVDIDGSGVPNLDLQRNQAKQRFGGYSYNDRGVQATNEAGRIFDDFWNDYVKTAEQADIVNSPEFQESLDKQKEAISKKNAETLSELEDQYSEARQTIADEYQKISKLGLDDYADDIKSGAIQSQFGNVDMDKRTIIEWSDELKQTYADELASWDYEPEIGSIDSVLGKSDRFGEDLNGIGWEVAFTPILPDGTLIDKDTVYKYINTILEEAYSNDGKLTEDELRYIDLQGRQIGDTFVKGIFAGIDDSQNYENNGNWADTVSRMMQFSGDSGSIGYVTNHINNELVPAIDNATENLDNVTLSAENYGKAFEEAQNKIAEASFDQVWADLVASEDDAVKELDADLLELAEKGRLTVDTFNEADSTGYFKTLGISADIAVSKINKLVDESKQLSSMSDQISKMSEALATKRENGFVEADTLSSFDVEVRGLESWDKFQTVLGSVTSSYEECQEAANELATEWVNSSDFLVQLTEDTKEYYKTQLESMGVENYDEVIESTLALKEAKEALADVDLSNASYEDIEALIQEGEYSALVTEQMWSLYYAKLAESGTFLDSSADCAQLQALANDAMLTAEAIKLVNELISIYNGLESGAYDGNRTARMDAMEAAETIQKKLKDLAKGEGEGLIAKPEIKIKGKKSAGGAGSSKDAWKEAYDAELKELEHMHKLGLISDEEYWKARMDLNEKYFGESSGMHKKYLEEYQENEEDILEGLKKLWEDYYDERKNNLKDLISYAEKLYDKEIDSLEANIKQIEEKRDTEKKYWQGRIDAIGDEIDALEDANDQRERAIDLQEKQMAVQRAMHQRTILLYSESKGMHYVNDSKAERSAKNDLDSAEHDNKIADLKKQQKELEKQLDAILETYDSQIEAIEKQIDSLKEVKSAWSDIVENQEFKELEERLKSLFGDDIKSKILSGNTDFINDIIAQYSDTSDMLRTIEDATLSDIQNMVAQYGILPENLVPISNAAADIANTLANVDTSGFNANMNNTAQSSSNAAEKVQNVTTALNNLSNDVANYQMPALNTDNFTSAFAEEGGILSALKGFMERYKEICDGIPDIWNNSLAEAFGQGGGNGDPLAGGLANDTKYDALFNPLVEALNNCKTNMEDKLKECLETFTTFQSDLSGIIGVGGGDSEESGSSKTGAEGGKGKGSGGKGKGSGGDKKSESGGGYDTIVGAIIEGGELIDQALNGEEDSWNASFITAAGSIHNTASYIVECIESMVETIVNACIAAIDAINMLERAEGGAGNHPTPPPYSRVGHGHGEIGDAFADGTGMDGLSHNEKNALVSEYGQTEMAVFPNGKTKIYTEPTLGDFPKGTVIYNEDQTKKLLRNKEHVSGNAYAKGTDADGWITLADGRQIRPLQPGDRTYDMMQKVENYLNSINGNIEKIMHNPLYDRQMEVEQIVNQITNNTAINNVSNNRNVQSGIHVDKIEITCPGVTSQQVVNEVSTALDKQLGHLSQRAMQEAYKR